MCCRLFLAYTLNWPVALFLSLLRSPGTLPADIQPWENIFTFKHHLKTHPFKLSPPVLPQVPLYLWTEKRYTYPLLLLLFLSASLYFSKRGTY